MLVAATMHASPRLAKSPTDSFPSHLSEIGLFADTAKLEPGPTMLEYELNVPFWSDGASKTRWMVMPEDKSKRVGFNATGEWSFPQGTAFVKHFGLPVDETHPQVLRRLETRVLIADGHGGVFGVTYKWRADNSDADLLATNLLEDVLIRTATGTRTQRWYYPSREDCLTCHTRLAGGVLGVTARQINRETKGVDGSAENQLVHWKRLGLFEGDPADRSLLDSPALARTDDARSSLQQRARSWMDANCANCHRPGGTVATFDARFNTPAEQQNLVNGPVLLDHGLDNARVIAANDVWRSIAFQRIKAVDEFKMPPVGRQVVDRQGLELMRQWIQNLPGSPVLAPPVISGSPGEGSTRVVIADTDPEATVRYTLDGSAPTKTSDIYSGPITLTNSTTVRARAYREKFTRSITVNETFILKP
jgi:uncharacterized repeat protein (TIGR03806 family)